jgi:LacI family transcriptional regulator
LLASGELPTAIFAANNFMAIGALQALREAGLEAPRDYSLGCVDDIALASMIDPFLTCAAQPAFEMGVSAANLLIDRLTGRGPAEPQEIVLPVPLLKRRSCQPLAR